MTQITPKLNIDLLNQDSDDWCNEAFDFAKISSDPSILHYDTFFWDCRNGVSLMVFSLLKQLDEKIDDEQAEKIIAENFQEKLSTTLENKLSQADRKALINLTMGLNFESVNLTSEDITDGSFNKVLATYIKKSVEKQIMDELASIILEEREVLMAMSQL